ncbi:MAG: hypothetical protein KA116_09645 [Proteobacteria bacterium]|nr:hypothetical protein [Pseudomonadota bacterium]
MKNYSYILAALLASNAFSEGLVEERYQTRDSNQDRRIEAGIGNGRITEGEASVLAEYESNIDAAWDRVNEDGVVKQGERLRMKAKMDRQHNRIYRANSNRH